MKIKEVTKIKADATSTKGASICNKVLHGDTDSHAKPTNIIGTVKTAVMNRAVSFLFTKLRKNSSILKPINKQESDRIGDGWVLSSNEQAETVAEVETKTENNIYFFSKLFPPVLVGIY